MNEHSSSEHYPRHVYNVLALRRSGQHGIVNWLIKSLERSGCEDVGHANNIFEFCHHPGQRKAARALTARQAMLEAEYPDTLVANYEDTTYIARLFSPAYHNFLAENVPMNDIIVVRDIYSLLASRLQKCSNNGTMSWRNPEALEPAWNDHAWHHANGTLTFINYNRWVQSPEYRMQLMGRLGLTSAEDAIQEVPNFGEGSSFDGRTLDGQALAMNVLARWNDLNQRLVPRFANIISKLHPKTVELNHELFGIGQKDVLADVEN